MMRLSWAPALFLLLSMFTACFNREQERIANLRSLEQSATTGRTSAPSDERLAELQQAVRRYNAIVDQKVEAAAQVSEYYKLLALEYISRDMYGLALENLQQAITIEPLNQILFYLAGVSAARMAQAMVIEQSQQAEHYQLAVRYLQRSLDLMPQYGDALYALAILNLYDLHQPAAAIDNLQRLMDIEPNNDRTLLLLAHSYAVQGNRNRAVDYYNKVIDMTKQRTIRQSAIEQRQLLLGSDQNE